MADDEICIDDPRAADVRALLALHLTFARAQTPPEDAHAMDVDGLLDPAVTFFGYRASGVLLAVGALNQLDASTPRSSRCTPRRPRGGAGSGG